MFTDSNRHKEERSRYRKEIRDIAHDFKGLTHWIENKAFPKDMDYWARKDKYENEITPLIKEMRIGVHKKIINNRKFRKEMKRATNRDFHLWINLYATTYNPIFDKSDITPAILFEYQLDFLKRIHSGESLICIKGRGMGFTWTKVWFDVWEMQRDRTYQAVVISRVEDDLDMKDDESQTIFGRMRFTAQNVPYKIVLDGRIRFMKHGKSQFIGKSSNPHAARSTRANRVYVEEAGVIENFKLIMRGVNAVSNQRILGGSVNGTANGFIGYWEGALSEEARGDKHEGYGCVKWTYDMHPLFRAPGWLENERLQYPDDEAGFNQEVLVDWWASVTNQIFTGLRKDHKEEFSDELKREFSHFESCVSIDVGFGTSPTSLWYYYYDMETDNYYYVDYVELKDSNYLKVAERLRTDGWLENTTHFVDQHSAKRGNDGETLTDLWIDEGLNVVEVSNRKIGASCKVSNAKLSQRKIHFDKYGPGIKNGFDLLSRYRTVDKYNAEQQDKNEAADAGDSFRYGHDASNHFRDKKIARVNKVTIYRNRGKYSRVKRRIRG